MKRFLCVFIFIFVIVAGSLLLHGGVKIPGYVLIVYKQKQMMMTLWSAVLLLLAILLSGIILVKCFSSLFGLPRWFCGWWATRRSERAGDKAIAAWSHILLGEFEPARKLLRQVVSCDDRAWWHILAAAKVAHQCGDYSQRDIYLAQVSHIAQPLEVSVQLLQAMWQLDSQSAELALETLNLIKNLASQHPVLFQLLGRIYQAMDDHVIGFEWLLTDTHGRGIAALTVHQWSFVQTVCLKKLAEQVGASKLKKLWKRIPQACQADAIILGEYALLLDRHGGASEAYRLLKHALQARWSDHLGDTYLNLSQVDGQRALRDMQMWLSRYPKHPCLLMLLAKVCLKQGMVARAHAYLKQAHTLVHTPDLYCCLAQLFLEMEEQTIALDCYRKGLELSCSHKHAD